MQLRKRAVIVFLAFYLVAGLVVTWGALQDDALIHLRYATFLHKVGFITFDGVHKTFGTSSLLFVGLLSILTGILPTPLLPGIMSVFFHILLFAMLAYWVLRDTPEKSATTVNLALLLIAILVAPSSLRWLDAGMETSLVLCLVAVATYQTFQLSLKARLDGLDFLLAMLTGFALVMLRSELVLVALASSFLLILCATPTGEFSLASSLRESPRNSHFVIGALLAALFVRWKMGYFLPDTAVAKSVGLRGFFPTIRSVGIVMAGSLLFGVATTLLWLASAYIVLRRPSTRRVATIGANLMFPGEVLLSAVRGQSIQGMRYLIWSLVFSICWNVLELFRTDQTIGGDERSERGGPITLHFAICAGVCVALLAADSALMWRPLISRVHTMHSFMAEDFTKALDQQNGIAGDVGYISYFTPAHVCDLNGLISGRAFAALTSHQRLAACISRNPSFVYMNSDQTQGIRSLIDLTDWKVCGVYDHGDLRTPDRHYLLVRPDLAETTCATTGFAAAPLAFALRPNRY